MAKVKKAQVGTRLKSRQYKRLGRIAEKNPERAEEVAGRMKLRATRTQRGKELAGDDAGAKVRKAMEEARLAPKAKEGKSFPDLNKDGKITKADILKGRGVIKNGGKIKKAQAGLKASDKRVGPIDPKGAWTKVQEQTIAGKKTPVSLKKDKELGATSMAKDGKWIQKAINPKHKGYCTPMTKKTCTPKRKALAMTLKKMGKARKGK